MKRFILILFIILMWAGIADATVYRTFWGRTGGAIGDLDNHNNGNCASAGTSDESESWGCCAGLDTGNCDPVDKDRAIVIEDDAGSRTVYHYWFQWSSTDAEDGWTRVRPDNYATRGQGVWHLIDAYSVAPQANPGVKIWDSGDTTLSSYCSFEANCNTADCVSPSQDYDGYLRCYVAGAITTFIFFDCDASGNCDIDLLPQGTGDLEYKGNALNSSGGLYTQSASTTQAGILTEIATATETTTGTDANRAVSPDGLAGSDYGKEWVGLLVFDDSQDTVTGNGAGDIFFRVPSIINGFNLVGVAAQVQTAGTTGNLDIMVYNVTQDADMLSTAMRIETTETDTSTSAQPGTIDTANDDVATGDSIRIDVDSVQTTKAKGLFVELIFQKP